MYIYIVTEVKVNYYQNSVWQWSMKSQSIISSVDK